MYRLFYIFVILASVFLTGYSQENAQDPSKFRVIREWKYINFTWNDNSQLRTAAANGDYIPGNVVIAGIKYYDGYYYITLPRMKNGVPATLTRIRAGDTHDTAPPMEPYPSWEMNSLTSCENLHNVQSVEIDTSGRLWAIDGGKVNTLLPQPLAPCSPKLLAFDLKKNEMVLKYEFPVNVATRGASYLYDLVVDETEGGYVYITDNGQSDPGIIVYSIKDNNSWKLRHSQSMRADPQASHFMINGESINTPINIAAIALGPRIRNSSSGNTIVDDNRLVYYTPLSSLHLFAINSTTLRNPENGVGEYQGDVKDLGLKTSQSVSMIMDNHGILYYSLLGENTISKWDSKTAFWHSDQVPIAKSPEYLQWPSSFGFDDSGNILTITNKLNKFLYGKLNVNDNNFRILQAYTGSNSYLYDDSSLYKTGKSLDLDKPMSSTESNRYPGSSSETPDVSNRLDLGNQNYTNSTTKGNGVQNQVSLKVFAINLLIISISSSIILVLK